MNVADIAYVERALMDADLVIDTLDPHEVFVLSGIDVPGVQSQISRALTILRRHASLDKPGLKEND